MQLLHLDKEAGKAVLAAMKVLHTLESPGGTKTHIGTHHGDDVTLTIYEFDDVAVMHFAEHDAFGGSVHFFATDAISGGAI